MKKKVIKNFFLIRIIIYLLILVLSLSSKILAQNQSALSSVSSLKQKEKTVIDVINRAKACVVSISTEKASKSQNYSRKEEEELFENFFRDFFYGDVSMRKIKQFALGSGVIVDAQGYILTNEFIVADAQQIIVTLFDGRKFLAKIKNVSYRENLAIIKIEADDLYVPELTDSDKVKPGQTVIAIGNPFGFSPGVPNPIISVGVIAALHRSLPHTTQQKRAYLDLIQTDAAINPGNSGGALFDLDGAVVGINVAVGVNNKGFGFTIPINRGKEILTKLKQGNEILKERFGIKVQDVNLALAEYFKLKRPEGALILEVYPELNPTAGKLKTDDVIVKFNNVKIKNTMHFLNEINKVSSAKKIKIKIVRNGLMRTFVVRLKNASENTEKLEENLNTLTENAYKQEQNEFILTKNKVKQKTDVLKSTLNRFRGMKVSAITDEFAQNFDIECTEGVIVTDVDSGSIAALAGIKIKDIITQINTKPIKSMRDYEQILPKLSGNVLVKTDRGYLILEDKID